MAHTVFYSWQKDAPSKICRNFIEKALTKAIEQLAEDLSIDEAIREGLALDKDTKGIAGTPPIVDTIFRKIDAAATFVADVTFVATRLDGRPAPNPNVLLEYGWALKSRGYSRIICVMNTAFGEPSDQTLPFNMKHLKWPIRYYLPEAASDTARAETQRELVKDLKGALQSIIQSDEFRALGPAPTEPPKFQPRDSVDGPARFRQRNEPIGVVDRGYGMGGAGVEVRLADGPPLWLRVMPILQPNSPWTIAELREVMSRAGFALIPMGFASSWSYVRGADGFGYVPHELGSQWDVTAVSFAFKSGEVWSIYTGTLATPTPETFLNIEGMITECFLRCIRVMHDGLNIELPYRWNAGIEGVKGKRMQHFAPPGKAYWDHFTAACLTDVIREAGILERDQRPQLALRPFFRLLYDACGEERGDYMDQPLLKLDG